jgi:hypothetical protein
VRDDVFAFGMQRGKMRTGKRPCDDRAMSEMPAGHTLIKLDDVEDVAPA